MNNDHITVFIHTFVLKQEVCVYENGICKEIVKCTTPEVEKVLVGLMEKYNIYQVDMAGSRPYCFKIKEHLQSKYSNKVGLNITIY